MLYYMLGKFFFAKLLSIYCYIVEGGKWKNVVFSVFLGFKGGFVE